MSAGYQLEPSALESVFDAIEQEYRDSRLSALQKLCFAWLRALTYAVPLLVGAALALEVLPVGPPELSIVVQVALFFVVPAVIVLAVLNAPLIVKAWRQLVLVHKLHQLRVAEEFWVVGARPGRSRWLHATLRFGPSVLLFLVFLYSVAFGPADQELRVTWWQTALVLVLCAGLPFAVAALDRLLARLRDRLDHFGEVQLLLRRLARLRSSGGEGGVELPIDLAQRLADMEKLHTLESRAAAMVDAERGVGVGYTIAVDDEFLASCDELPESERLPVERAIVRLSLEPRLGELGGRPGERVLRLEGTNLAILYSLNEPERSLEIRALSRATQPGPDRE